MGQHCVRFVVEYRKINVFHLCCETDGQRSAGRLLSLAAQSCASRTVCRRWIVASLNAGDPPGLKLGCV